MAIYTNFFVCSEEELSVGLPGWKVPLEKPVRKEDRHPVTGKPMEVWSWDPDPSTPSEDRKTYPPGVVAGKGDYEQYLEARAHPLVQESAHVCLKGIDTVTLATLEAILLGSDALKLIEDPLHYPPARISPPEASCEIVCVPESLVGALATLEEEQARKVGGEWAKTEELEVEDSEALELIHALKKVVAQITGAEKKLFLMVEW